MRRIRASAALACLLLAWAPGAASAVEWGGLLYNISTPAYSLSSEELNLLQEDDLTLWLETELNPRMSLTAQGSLVYRIDGLEPLQQLLFPNLDFLWFQGQFPVGDASLLQLNLGRFAAFDFSRLLFDDILDGARLSWRTARANLTLSVGYLGLQLQEISTVSMSAADANNASIWAPPRLLEMLEIELPGLFAGQDLLVSVAAQQDFRSRSGLLQPGDTIEVLNDGGRLSTEYLGVAVRGQVTGALYYDLFGYLETGRTLSYIDGVYQYAWMISGLAGAGLRFFQEAWLSSRAELRLLWSSGDADYNTFLEGNRAGLATMFVGVSRPELAVLFSPSLGNLVLAEASWSVKPAEMLQTLLKATSFLRPTLGPVSDYRVDPASSSRYLGTELDAAARLRPFSDLGLAFTAGVFLPSAAFRPEYSKPVVGGRFELSFTF
jgi:hypothetical protein